MTTPPHVLAAVRSIPHPPIPHPRQETAVTTPELTADVRGLLDQLDQAHAAGTPGPWRQDDQFPQYFGAEDRGGLGETRRDADAALIVAAVNALPELIAKIRELDARISAGLALADEWENDDHPEGWNYSEYLRAALAAPLAGQNATDEWDEES